MALQGAVGIVTAVILALRTMGGGNESAALGYGTAGMFAVLGAAVLVAGLALVGSRRAGRGPAVVVQVVALPVAWSLLTGSDQVLAGLLVGGGALATLTLLLARPAQRWMGQQYDAALREDAEPPDGE